MDSLANTFKKFADLFNDERSQTFGSNSSTELLHSQAPKIISDFLSDNSSFKVYGSVGAGNWAEIPWVAILDKEISLTTQNGYYIAYLFDKNLDYIYLCLSLGYMQFEKEYGIPDARTRIQTVAQHYASVIKSSDSGFRSGHINLNAENNLGKGYELGSVLSKRYKISSLNDTELQSDLLKLLDYYQELKAIVGDSVLNIEVDLDADLFDERIKSFQKVISAKTYKTVDEKIIDELLQSAEVLPRRIKERAIKQIVRNRKIVDWVKQQSNYICTLCGREPFVQKNGRPYAEADHIIPLGGKTMGPDSAKNLRCVCAQCHAIITYGSEEEKKRLIARPTQ